MDIIQAVRERRSINFFDPAREIPEEKIVELLELANNAPSSMNLQPWRVVVVNNRERKKTLRACAFNQPKVDEASAVLIMVADPLAVELNIEHVLKSWADLGYMKPEMAETYRGMVANLYGSSEGLSRKLFAVKNTSLYAMSIMLAAKGIGIETHPMDGFDEACIKKEFGIPDDKIIPMLIAVGWLKPGITLLPRAFRRRLEEFVTYNNY